MDEEQAQRIIEARNLHGHEADPVQVNDVRLFIEWWPRNMQDVDLRGCEMWTEVSHAGFSDADLRGVKIRASVTQVDFLGAKLHGFSAWLDLFDIYSLSSLVVAATWDGQMTLARQALDELYARIADVTLDE